MSLAIAGTCRRTNLSRLVSCSPLILLVFVFTLDSLSELNDEQFQGVWRHMLLAFFSALTADCTPALSLDFSIQERDETFDLCLLSTLELDILPHLGGKRVPSELIVQLGKTLSKASRIYRLDVEASSTSSKESISEGEESDPSHNGKVTSTSNGMSEIRGEDYGTTAQIVRSPRERFSYWTFDLLLLVCSDRFTGK